MKKTLLIFLLSTASLLFGGTSGLYYVFQPLTTFGTDQETRIIIAKIPILSNAVPEGIISYISAAHKLQQKEPAFVEDSNLLSRLGIKISAEWISENNPYEVTLDLSAIKQAELFELTEQAVVESAITCIKSTIDQISGQVAQRATWKIRLISKESDQAKWSKYNMEYLPKRSE